MKKLALILLCSALAISGCKKDEEPENPNAPGIAFIDITPTKAKETVDQIIITIRYSDKDGDLGENDPNVTNVFVTDKRNDVEYAFRMQELAPEGETLTITGNLDIEVPNTSIIGTDTSEAVNYDVYITDRAGNNSNTITTSSITITQ